MTADDATGQPADELLRFVRWSAHARGMLDAGDLGAGFSALRPSFPLRHRGPLRVTDPAEVQAADPATVSHRAARLVRAGPVRRDGDRSGGAPRTWPSRTPAAPRVPACTRRRTPCSARH